MKIWYAVNAVGNGHITRARVMAKELNQAGIDVDFLFTGRPPDKYFDMEVFGDYKTKTGLTFTIKNGQVNYLKTVLESHTIQFIKDVKSLDLSNYDFVICDYEPITAWAAKLQGVPVIGLGHQYAFNTSIPIAGADCIAKLVMKNFAPVTTEIGLHWHHFNQHILPPIIDILEIPTIISHNKILVYLPFEDQQTVIKVLAPFTDFNFYVYSPEVVVSPYAHIKFNLPSRDGFQKDLYNSVGVICNAGFELVSEALQLGKKILAKPVGAQMEQISNAAALVQLGYGYSMDNLDIDRIADWLYNQSAIQLSYPNVARSIVQWLQHNTLKVTDNMVEEIWKTVKITSVDL